MAVKYFAFLDGTQQGPFDLYDLKAVGVRPSTYVWCKGMDDWHRADEVVEIRDLFHRHLEEKADPVVTIKAPTTAPLHAPQETSGEVKPEPIRFGRIPASSEPEINIDTPPQVSMTLAVLALILCCPPAGIAAVVFTHKAQKTWEAASKASNTAESDNLKRQAHEYGRLAKMWLGLTVAFGIILWTLVFSVRKF